MSAGLEPITVTIRLTRETKNIYRYDSVDDVAPVSNLYIQKKALPNGAPQELELRLTAGWPWGEANWSGGTLQSSL